MVYDLIVCRSLTYAQRGVRLLERAGVSDIKVVGIDGTTPGLQAVEDGKMMGTVSSDKEAYAKAIFEIAAAKALGEELPENIVLEDGKYYSTPQRIVVEN